VTAREAAGLEHEPFSKDLPLFHCTDYKLTDKIGRIATRPSCLEPFMSTLFPEPLVEAQHTGIEQLFAFSSAAFEGIEKLTELNLQVVKATLAENQALMAKALAAKPEELIALSSSLAKPTAEKIAAYSRHVYEIMSGVQIALTENAPSQYQQYARDA
jgi:phasin family protein